jgi:hypothetical protein
MPWTLIVGIVASVALIVCVLWLGWRWNRTPPELRGDWWPGFEREFRAYAEAAAGADEGNDPGEARRQGRQRNPPSR